MALFDFAGAYFERFCLREKVRVRSDNPRINVSDPKTATKRESRFSPCWPVMYTTAPPTIDRTANVKTAHFSLSISPFLIIGRLSWRSAASYRLEQICRCARVDTSSHDPGELNAAMMVVEYESRLSSYCFSRSRHAIFRVLYMVI